MKGESWGPTDRSVLTRNADAGRWRPAEDSTMSDSDRNFAGLVEASSARAPARPALFAGNQAISYGELARRIDAFAGAMEPEALDAALQGRKSATGPTLPPETFTSF